MLSIVVAIKVLSVLIASLCSAMRNSPACEDGRVK
jgi:hypothetical protein